MACFGQQPRHRPPIFFGSIFPFFWDTLGLGWSIPKHQQLVSFCDFHCWQCLCGCPCQSVSTNAILYHPGLLVFPLTSGDNVDNSATASCLVWCGIVIVVNNNDNNYIISYQFLYSMHTYVYILRKHFFLLDSNLLCYLRLQAVGWGAAKTARYSVVGALIEF